MSGRDGGGAAWPRPVKGGRPLAPPPDPREALATLANVPASPPEFARSWLDLAADDYPDDEGGER